MTGWYVVHQRYDEEIPGAGRLGRHKLYDSRSLAYPYQAPERTVTAVLHKRHIPILDQGQVGSCTGNAMVGALGTSPDWDDLEANFKLDMPLTGGGQVTGTMTAAPILNEAEALKIYSAAEVIDGGPGYPAEDNGSSGQSVAKAAKNMKLISGYTWCTTIAQMEQALQDDPQLVGMDWYDSMDSPASNGLITISKNAVIRGGHELEFRGVDPVAKQFFGDNSWSAAWGPIGGSFVISYATMEQLLAEGGDCVVPVPLAAPAPVPVPVPPTPRPPLIADQFDMAFNSVATPWLNAQQGDREDYAENYDMVQAFRLWRRSKGL